jgi:hypothetical protein
VKKESSDYYYAIWHELFKSYTNCSVAYPWDKFVALASIAARMATLVEDEYVARFFKRTLPVALAWKAGDGTKCWNGICQAPAWCWAAVDGPLTCIGASIDEKNLLATVSKGEVVG